MTERNPEADNVEAFRLPAGDEVPNHPRWPLLVYRQAIAPSADEAEQRLHSNGWAGTWRNGVFPYHHYHTASHEVLAIVSGTATVQFGGPQGKTVEVSAGDVAILPAGTGHKRLDASEDFLVVGAYPQGQENYDVQRDAPDEDALRRIDHVSRPSADPVFGREGPLMEHWRQGTD